MTEGARGRARIAQVDGLSGDRARPDGSPLGVHLPVPETGPVPPRPERGGTGLALGPGAPSTREVGV